MSLAAQGDAQGDVPRTWIDRLYPYGYYSTVDGLWGGALYGWSAPMVELGRPEPHYADLRLLGAASTKGSYRIALTADAPAWWTGWRVGLRLDAARANRFGYYGQGNDTRYDPDSVRELGPYYYRVSRTSRIARLTVQRRIAGPLRVLLGGSLERTAFRILPGESRFRRDSASGAVSPDDDPFTDAVIRAGLVLDWRDQEIDPHRGIFAEALVADGNGYTRTTAALRGYVHPLERLIVAARIAGERITGSPRPPVAPQLTMESSEGAFVALGGYRSLRGFHDGRFLGPGKLVGGVEVRYAIRWRPRLFEIKLVAFYDVGRVFGPGEAWRLTTDGLHHGGGAAVAAALLRNTLVVVGVARSREGTEAVVGTRWSY
ncbi:MAG: BamA/TamA family outer membrane protein [Gemmatimonadales bacterium]